VTPLKLFAGSAAEHSAALLGHPYRSALAATPPPAAMLLPDPSQQVAALKTALTLWPFPEPLPLPVLSVHIVTVNPLYCKFGGLECFCSRQCAREENNL
jgi:hypothetical protein